MILHSSLFNATSSLNKEGMRNNYFQQCLFRKRFKMWSRQRPVHVVIHACIGTFMEKREI